MTKRLLQCCLCILLSSPLLSQGLVHPGDANNDGLVNHHDLLSVGYAYGNFGGPRSVDAPSGGQYYNMPWTSSFPNGLNYIYADADGNGQINFLDFLLTVLNFGNTYSGGFNIEYPTGQAGIDPEINLNNGSELDAHTISGQTLVVPLNAENLSFDQEINGLALTLTIDPNLVDSFNFIFSGEWIQADGEAFPFVRKEENTIKLALTRFGNNPVSQPVGEIGSLRVIIIEDLVGLLPNTPDQPTEIVSIDAVQLVDGDFDNIATTRRGLNIAALRTVSNTSEVETLTKGIQLQPNPSNGQLLIESKRPFNRVEIISITGMEGLLYSGVQTEQKRLELDDYPAGLYYLRLTGKDWHHALPFVVE